MKPSAIACTALVAALITACTSWQEPIGERGEGKFVRVVDRPPELNRKLDLLFVVDNSETMAPKQQQLLMSFRKLMGHLNHMRGGLPDFHVGVVSTDMGVGFNQVSSCGISGDQGSLQNTKRISGCSGPDDHFIKNNGINTNHDGELNDAFSCIAPLGVQGCQFEQPLQSMQAALDGYNAQNDGFLRDDAALGVIFLTDEDDCSVSNTDMFAPTLKGEGLRKFRCFEHGVTCGGDDVRAEGDYRNCDAKQDSQYMPHVSQYANFLKDLKFGDESQVVVTGIFGEAELVNIAVGVDEQYKVEPACSGGVTGEAYPAVRLQGFLDQFSKGGDVGNLCGNDGFDVLRTMSKQLRKTLGTTCLDGKVLDADLDRAGVQPECRVFDVAPASGRKYMPKCSVDHAPWLSDQFPCYRIITGPESCGDFPGDQLALDVCRGPNATGDWCLADEVSQPLYTRTIAECLVARTDD